MIGDAKDSVLLAEEHCNNPAITPKQNRELEARLWAHEFWKACLAPKTSRFKAFFRSIFMGVD